MKNEIEKTETTLVVLPDEVKELALKVPELKQKEVQTVLSQIFAGTADWKKQADSIIVKDVNDSMSIQLAETGRKNVKNARLAAEKIFDAKRDEVQQKKSEFDLEDKLWLKAKQTAQILFKDIESTFEWKAKFKERFEAEQKELITQLRIEKVSKFSPEVNRIEIENMSDNLFDIFLSGLEKAYNDRIAAEKKAEEDRLAAIEAEIVRQENIRLENEKLKKEAEEKEKALEAEKKIRNKRSEDLRPYIIFIRDYDKMISLPEKEYQKEFLDIQRAAKEHYEYEAKEKQRKQKEQQELIAKQAEERAQQIEKDRKQSEEKEKTKAEKAAKLAPDKTKLLNFMQAINDLPRPEVKSIEAANIAANANALLIKVVNYIKENANKL